MFLNSIVFLNYFKRGKTTFLISCYIYYRILFYGFHNICLYDFKLLPYLKNIFYYNIILERTELKINTDLRV